jgi:hypothetical protein
MLAVPFAANRMGERMSKALWSFSNLVSEERKSQLLRLSSFDQVVESVISTNKIRAYQTEPFKNERLKGCDRASFLLSVDPIAYDAFFNSPSGYRAQFCHGPGSGEAANRQIINRLRTSLMEFARDKVDSKFDLDCVAASLDGKQAKIWILEDGRTQPGLALKVEIEYDAWVERANSFDQCQSDDLAGSWRGVLAPIGSELEVKGGWLKNGKEVIDPVKEVRSEQIRLNGYA